MSDKIVRPAQRDDFFTRPPMHVILVEPEIPPNTGNVSRTCYATGSTLHLIEPLGFEINNARLRRAGLDYWEHADIRVHKSLDDVIGPIVPPEQCFFFTTRATKPIWEAPIKPGSALVFGKESTGLGPVLLEKYKDQLYHLPVVPGTVRSINLSNTVAVALYDCYRQLSNTGWNG
jgi:tRNA (cytidine/uridine-2'-O-)-methyltransferase